MAVWYSRLAMWLGRLLRHPSQVVGALAPSVCAAHNAHTPLLPHTPPPLPLPRRGTAAPSVCLSTYTVQRGVPHQAPQAADGDWCVAARVLTRVEGVGAARCTAALTTSKQPGQAHVAHLTSCVCVSPTPSQQSAGRSCSAHHAQALFGPLLSFPRLPRISTGTRRTRPRCRAAFPALFAGGVGLPLPA